jgi:hypothetical protein
MSTQQIFLWLAVDVIIGGGIGLAVAIIWTEVRKHGS